MDGYKKLLDTEVDSFKMDLKNKKQINFKILTKDEFAKCFRLAFHDAFGQYCRRKGKKYKERLNEFLNNDFHKFYATIVAKFKKECKESSPSFDYIVNYLNPHIKNIIKSDIKEENEEDISYGLLQKVTSMILKYLYCFENVKDLRNYYMPLDSFILSWYKNCEIQNLDDNIKQEHKRLCKHIKNWTNLSKEDFKDVQKNILAILTNENYKYVIKFDDKNYTIPLSKNRLEAEFVIWRYEQLKKDFNDVRSIKEKGYFEIEISLKQQYYFSSLYL